ncbi:hypothetical protein MRX96_012549 [Rhipicephalus microplus]
MLMPRRRRLGDIHSAEVVAAGLDALLAGKQGSHHLRQVLVHRYSGEQCPAEGEVVDMSAAEAVRRTLSSQPMILWKALFVG